MTADIDKIRMKSQEVAKIISLEKETTKCNEDCRRCVYKEQSVGMCWYLMVHNKPNGKLNNTCKHFVDWEDYNNKDT